MLAGFGLAGGDGLLAARGDFAEIWAGSRAIVLGRDPYDTATWTATLAELAGRFTPVPAFVYPPYVALALLPLALLPLGTAALAWTAFGVSAASVALGAAVRSFGVPPRAAFLLGFALLASGPAAATYAQGQWDFFVLAFTLGAATLARRFPLLAGVAAGAVLAKPQLALFSLWALVRASRARPGLGFGVGLAIVAAAIALTIAATPAWWASWLGSATTGFVSVRPLRAATLGTLLVEPLGLAGALAAAAIVFGLVAIALYFDGRGAPGLAVGLTLGVAAAPYAQAYDHLLLIAPLAIASGAAARRSVRRAELIAGTGVIILVVVWTALYAGVVERGSDPYGALIPLAVFGSIAGALWRQRRERDTR